MDKPLVTIVTPVYNQGKFIEETIRSVLNQDYSNIEYLVIDDGSTDDTPEVLSKFSDQISCLRQENVGQAETLNRGWETARGEIIGYLSADDILYPGAVSKLVRVLERDKDTVCVFPDADLIDNESRVVKKSVCRPFDLADLVVLQECYIGPGALFRRSAFQSSGGWRSDLRLAPDREFWIRLASCGNFKMLTEVLAGYRMHPLSISYKEVSEDVSREYLYVLDSYFAATNIPKRILARKNEAYGHANLVIARNCFRAGRLRVGFSYYSAARSLHPQLGSVRTWLRLIRNVVSRPIRTVVARTRAMLRRAE
jgi:glycosyltransferase involved in cell wall biosynthesis